VSSLSGSGQIYSVLSGAGRSISWSAAVPASDLEVALVAKPSVRNLAAVVATHNPRRSGTAPINNAVVVSQVAGSGASAA